MSDEENVRVAVRVRPFHNKREDARKANLIVDMKGATTYLQDPNNPQAEPKSFNFDYSYWSHDGCKADSSGFFGQDAKHANGRKFADQKKVFDDLGMGVLTNAWNGYNSTIFAYGQTGSGKSWSVVGYGINKGIVPQFCEEMYKGIDKKRADGEAVEFEVQVSMLEIYMEEVRDLLNNKRSKGGLRIRQHPKKGFYADGLTVSPVGSYAEIEGKTQQGTTNRTVAATNMNATSSRAHTIVGITLTQKFKNSAGQDTTKSAVVNLVDLAGSERAESTGATGDRLKEGAAINQSLSSLGNCIAALADRAGGKDTRVPYRDSVLTKLLKNALGGNSRTVMIAAISPADINYDETLSTLRYADRAKQIKTKATVNEDPTDKLIRELQEENDKLKQMLEGGGMVMPAAGGDDDSEMAGMSDAEKKQYKSELEEDYRAQLDANANEMEEMKKTYQEKLDAAIAAGGGVPDAQIQINERKKTVPHIYNLNVDPQLTGNIISFVDDDKELVGNGKRDDTDIVIRGPSILEHHATFTHESGQFYLDKLDSSARVLRNGQPLTQKTEIHHNDRLLFGTTQLYVFCNQKERDASKEPWPEVTYEMVQEEFASNSGFDMKSENKSKDDMLLQEDLVDMLPAVEEANSISEELNRKKKFEVMLVSPEARGELKGRTKIYVKMTDLESEMEWVWTREKFFNRKFVMQEMFEKCQDGEEWEKPQDTDPFYEDEAADVHIGSVKCWLQSLSYNIEIKEQLEVTDFKGSEVGILNLEILPCDKKGKVYTESDDVWVDNPQNMVGKSLHFQVQLTDARGLPKKYDNIYAKFLVYLDDEFNSTQAIKGTSNPEFKYKKQFDYDIVTSEFVEYLCKEAIMIQIWGQQKPAKTKKAILNTRDVLQKQSLAKGQASAANTNTKSVDAQKVKFAMELAVARKKAEKAEAKVGHFRELVRLAEEYKKERLSTKLIRDLLHAPTHDAAQKCLRLVPKEKGADLEEPSTPRPKTPKKSSGAGGGGGDDGQKSSTCVLL